MRSHGAGVSICFDIAGALAEDLCKRRVVIAPVWSCARTGNPIGGRSGSGGMHESQQNGFGQRGSMDMSAVALSVVAELAARNARQSSEAELVLAMKEAVISTNPGAFDTLRHDLRRARITETDLVDSYFPAVARALGCDWVGDSAGFAAVTIGMTRLQILLHRIIRTCPVELPIDSPSILVVLPLGEQHSFGVQILAEQLRRRGASAHVLITPSMDRLRELVCSGRYDGAMVSVGCDQGLEPAVRVVRSIKQASQGGLWVAVGGSMLEREPDLQARLGADIATQDPDLAMVGMRSAKAARDAEDQQVIADSAWKRLETA